MNLNFWLCVMHVMGRLKIWRPYLVFVDGFLRQIDRATEADMEKAKNWIASQPQPVQMEFFRRAYGFGWDDVLKMLEKEGAVVITIEHKIRLKRNEE